MDGPCLHVSSVSLTRLVSSVNKTNSQFENYLLLFISNLFRYIDLNHSTRKSSNRFKV